MAGIWYLVFTWWVISYIGNLDDYFNFTQFRKPFLGTMTTKSDIAPIFRY